MKEYHKINSIFKRDMEGNKKLIIGEWSTPEFEFLQNNAWEFTEKVDGTNIRMGWIRTRDGVIGPYLEGRTDKAVIPRRLQDALIVLASKAQRHVVELMEDRKLETLTIYGEGYGAGIQNGGNYRPDPSFVPFDVKVGDFWLKRADAEDICDYLHLGFVPVIGYGTLHDAVDWVRDYRRTESRWGQFTFEGIVARPVVQMFDRKGERIIAKIKVRDFE